MSQNLEIEFKNMLTQGEYGRFLQAFNITDTDIFTQENHYFDTADFALKEKGTALRIRKKSDLYEMTLKQPAKIGLLETNQTITSDEADLAISLGKFPFGPIKDILAKTGVPAEMLEYFGSLITRRAELAYRNGLLVLDHSIYLNAEDYELEFEAAEFSAGEETFRQLLGEFCIPIRKTENKIRRFYNRKYKSRPS